MKIKVPNNTAQLGVEISDLNLSGEFSDDQIAEIRKSWTDYGVAIFPDLKSFLCYLVILVTIHI